MRLLLVEDEIHMAEAVSELLRQEKYDVDVFNNGIEGKEAILSNIYDGAILDVMLPGMNGFEIVGEARRAGLKTPILMLTAKSEVADKVYGLDKGADDYLTKPFEVTELLARVRALVRRNSKTMDGTLKYGDISLNQNTLSLSCTTTGQEVRLSEKEYKILECLITNAGQIISKEQLALKVWGYENEAEYNNVEVYITFTRRKLNFIKAGTVIKAVRGMGYELNAK